MNKRGFASAVLAFVGGLFLQRKTTWEGESETFKIGDAVRVDVPPNVSSS